MSKPNAVLYARVSTDEQATKGYSIREQERELLAFAAREGYEVAAMVADEGISGTTDSPDRPGLREVMALAESGRIDVVVTKRRDRLFRSRLFRLMCEQDLAEYGVKLRSMDDTGNAIGDAVLDTLAEEEIRVIVERTRAGRFGRARKGLVLGVGGNARAPFGFSYSPDRSGLVVDEAEMATVRRVFHAVGVEGKSLWRTCRELEASGVPTPKGGKRWHANTIRRWINSDLYLPHTHEEVAARVSGEVATGLDEDALFGLWCYGQQRVSKASGKTKREGKRRRYHKAPADDIVAVPVPLGNSSSLSGVPRKWAEAARECIRGNEWVSNASGRVWELSGGILRCGHCGRAMTLHTVGKHRYHYYFCPGRRDKLGCENRHHRAERLEAAVVAYVDGELLADRETLERRIDETIAQHQAPSLFRDPDGRARALTKALTDYEAERAGYVRQAARDRITDAELDGFLAEVDARKNAAVEELAKIHEAEATAQEAEATKRAILDMYGTGLQNGVYWFPPVLRRAVYAALGLRVEVFGDRTVRAEGVFDANLMRLIPEVEAYAEGLRRIDERIADAPPEDTRERIDRIERELAALRDRFLCEGAPTPRGG